MIDAFLSYNRADAEAVERVAAEMRARGLEPCLDAWSLMPGVSWPDALERQLAECLSFVAFVGPSGSGAWQKREIQFALDRQADDPNFPVIPALLPGADEPPLGFLRLNTWVDLRDGCKGPALDRLVAAVRGRRFDPSDRTDPRVEICPYRGLGAFREEDAPFFFGRDTHVGRLLSLVTERRLVVVTGPSGSGKSSLVAAGLVPALRARANERVWDVLTLRPGLRPLEALIRAFDPADPALGLAAVRVHLETAARMLREGALKADRLAADFVARQVGTDHLLIVVDQFEEIVTLCEDREEADQFVDVLIDLATRPVPTTVVATMRSDFFGIISERRDLSDLAQGGALTIGPPRRDAGGEGPSELEEIVRRPAEAVGLGFEDGLVERILGDVGDEPGKLPLLEYLLTELWRRRTAGRLTHEDYDAVGGVEGAIATRADGCLAELTPAERNLARRVMLSTVRVAADGRATRLVAPMPRDPAARAVVERFSGPATRLLVADGDCIEMAHEALIRSWATLRRWIERNAADLQLRDRVRERAARWRARGQEPALLLPTGLDLEEGRRLVDATELADPQTADFVERSIAADDKRRAAEREREEADRRREIDAQRGKRRVALVALAVSVALLAAAATQWWRAEQGAEAARRAEGLAEAQAEAADAAREREAAQRSAAEEARAREQEQRRLAEAAAADAKREADLAVARRLAAMAEHTLEENPGETSAAAMIAVGSLDRAVTPEGVAALRGALALTPGNAAPVDGSWADNVVFSPDGTVAMWSRGDSYEDNEAVKTDIALLDAAGLETIWTGTVDGGADVTFASTNATLAVGGATRKIVLVDPSTPGEPLPIPTEGDTALVSSRDGKTLYAVHEDGHIEERSAPNWRVARVMSFPRARGGTRIEAQLLAGGAQLLILQVDGGTDALGTLDLDSGQWEAFPVRLDLSAEARDQGRIIGVAAAGGRALSQHDDNTARLWDLGERREVRSFRVESNRWLWTPVLSRDGLVGFAENPYWADSTDGGVVHLVSPEGVELASWVLPGKLRALAFSPDGDWLVAGGTGGVTARLVTDGTVIQALSNAEVRALAFDGAGQLLAGAENGGLYRVDLDSGDIITRASFKRPVRRIAVSADGARVAVSLGANSATANWSDFRLTLFPSGERLGAWSWNGTLTDASLAPGGRRIAALETASDRILVFDARTGQRISDAPREGAFIGFDPTGRMLLDDDYKLVVHNAATGRRIAELGEPGGVFEARWSKDGRSVTTQGSGVYAGWSVPSGRPTWRTEAGTPASSDWRSADGRLAAAYDARTGALRIIDAADGSEIGAIAMDPPDDAALSDDGRRLVTAHPLEDLDGRHGPDQMRLSLWRLDEAAVLWSEVLDTTGKPFVTITPFAGGDFVIEGAGSEERTLLPWWRYLPGEGGTVWDPASEDTYLISHFANAPEIDAVFVHEITRSGDFIERRDRNSGQLIWRRDSAIAGASQVQRSVDVSPREAREIVVYEASYDRSILQILDADTGAVLRERAVNGDVKGVRFSSDGAAIIVAIEQGSKGRLAVLEAADLTERQSIALLAALVQGTLRGLADPDLVAFRDAAQTVKTWNIRTGEPAGLPIAMAVAADIIAVATRAPVAATLKADTLSLWDLGTEEAIATRTIPGEALHTAIAPDGSRAAVTMKTFAGFEALEIIDPDAPDEPMVVPAEKPSGAVFSPDGTAVAFREGEGRVRVVDVSTAASLLTASALRKGEIGRVTFTADGSYVVFLERFEARGRGMSVRRTGLRAFAIETRREVARLDVAGSVLATPRGAVIIYNAPDGRLHSLDLAGAPLDPVLASSSYPNLATAAKSTRALAVSYYTGGVAFDAQTGGALELLPADDPNAALSADISADGKHALLSLRERDWSEDSPGLVVVRDAQDGAPLALPLETKRPYLRARLAGDGVAILSELRTNYVDHTDFELRWWNWRDGVSCILVDDNPVTNVVVSPDQRLFATAEGSLTDNDDDRRVVGTRQVRVWEVGSGAEVFRLPTGFDFARLAFSPDNKFLAVFEQNRGLVVDLESGSIAVTVSPAREAREDGTPHLAKEIVPWRTNYFWPGFAEGGRIFAVVAETEILLRDMETGDVERLPLQAETKTAAFSSDGRHVALWAGDAIEVWDISGRALVARVAFGNVGGLAFAGSDASALLAVVGDEVLRVEWAPERLASRACTLYAGDRWQRSLARLIGQEAAQPVC